MTEYNYDKLIKRALEGKKLTRDEWIFLINEDKEVGRVEDEPRRWCKWVEVIIEYQDKYYSIGYDEGLTECQENDYCDSGIIEVKPVKKIIEVIEWKSINEE